MKKAWMYWIGDKLLGNSLPPIKLTMDAPPWMLPLLPEEIRRRVGSMLRMCSIDLPGGLEISFLRDGDIWQINKDWLGCDGPTNVLAFPPSAPDMPGSLLISADTLHRECFLYGQKPQVQLTRLLAHGLAHVLGYDHSQEMNELCESFMTECLRPSA